MEVVLVTTLVERMRVIVILIVNAMKIINVELTIAEVHLALNLFMIVAILWKKVFAQLKIPVGKIKEIVIMMLNALMNLSVG